MAGRKESGMQELRKVFVTDGKPYKEGMVSVFEQRIEAENIKKAVLTITALGMYEAELGGRKVGDELFSPGYTYYPKELQYQVYDVTGQIRQGETLLRVYLGQGWYCGRFTFDNKTQIYGEDPAVAWILELEDAKGKRRYTSADDTVCLVQSPYEYAGLYDGEIYDGGVLGSGDGCWSDVKAGKPVPYTGTLPEEFVQRFCAVRLREEMPVKNVTKAGDVTILDFGQNFAGIVTIDPTKISGESIRIRHGEILNPDGTLYTNNLRKAKAEIIYRKGGETAVYRPRFTYMGFRYIELSGAPYQEGLLTAYAIYSDMVRTGDFTCENSRVSRLFLNQLWGQKSNYVEVPTDCPQRDERMGYTGDGHVFARTGAYNFDTRIFWRKFLADIRYSQMDNSEGYIPSTVPAQGPGGIGFLNMLGWGNAVTLIPEMLYWQYGEESFLIEQYDSIKKFVDCECRKLQPMNLWMGPNLGDWLTLGRDVQYMAMHNGPVSNSFIVHDLEVASKLAVYLGCKEDAARWGEQLEKTRKAYIETFIQEDGTMKDDYQGAYVMALQYVLHGSDLEELHTKVYGRLVERICRDGMQTGFFATQHILPMLADHGDVKLAYDLLLQPDCPGWMYQVDRGATTTWERWDALQPDGTVNESKMSDDNMVSFNHYAFGSVGEFYYRYILGIQPLKPGFREIAIRPYVDARLGSVSGSYDSAAGRVEVSWKVEGDQVETAITTPVKTILILPDGTQKELEMGSYSYHTKI